MQFQKNIFGIERYLILWIVFLAGNRLSSVKYTTYRKKGLGNEN